MNILDKLLKKRGIKNVSELDEQERHDFDRWREILKKEKLEIEDIQQFCETQKADIESRFGELDPKTASRLTLVHSVYGKLIEFIKSPESEREMLIQYLEGLLEVE